MIISALGSIGNQGSRTITDRENATGFYISYNTSSEKPVLSQGGPAARSRIALNETENAAKLNFGESFQPGDARSASIFSTLIPRRLSP